MRLAGHKLRWMISTSIGVWVAKSQYDGIRPAPWSLVRAERYLIERAHKASIDTDALHISALLPFPGKRPLRQITGRP